MSGKILTCAILLGVFGLVVAGCERTPEVAEKGTVKANPAFLEHFGQPPIPEKGICFARVGFFASTDNPGKVRAVPYFLFSETGQLEQILQRMSNERDIFLPATAISSPFPPGTKADLSFSTDGLAELSLRIPESGMANLDAAILAAALTETAVQFDEIDRVRILVNGQPLQGMPVAGFRHQPDLIASPGPPTVLAVIGTWEAGSVALEEILVGFDRPVVLDNFQLLGGSGQAVKGEYYRSVFDMAVVIHPESPQNFTAGMTLRAEWDVTDSLGRRGKGAGDFTLIRHDH